MTSTLKRLAGKQVALYLSMSVDEDGYRAFFRFGTSNQAENVADRLYNRRACSALQGIGGWATNKQSAKSKTFALLATIENGKTFPSLTNFRWQLIKWAKLCYCT